MKTAKLTRSATHLLGQIAMAMISIAMALPMFWMLSTSFKPESEVLTMNVEWLPSHFTLENYQKLFSRVEEFPVLRWIANSALVSLSVTFLVLTVCSMAAYALSRLRFPGRNGVFSAIIGSMALPGQAVLIPVFLIVQTLGLFNNYGGLILPGLASAFGVFLLRQFMLGIPAELEEAARMDGASDFRIFWRVILPLTKPALATLGLFTFVGSWNDFAWPLIVTNRLEMRTLPVGLSIFQGRFTSEFGLVMAAAVITTLPMIAAFIIFQKGITSGISITSDK
jgi:multiple sugar transport system permease protein